MPPADAARRRAVFVRHHEEDDPGFVGAAMERRGYAVEVVLVEDATSTVDLEGVDVLCVLGSKWSVYDHDAVGGWIDVELGAIREADRRGVAVLGICFGAQALCVAMGGHVEPALRAEVGWVDLPGAPDGSVPEGPWFEYHSDRCVLPEAAQPLVRNEVCVQAFSIGRHLGVQFHPELDAGQFTRWLDAGAREATEALGLDPATLLEQVASHELDAARRVDELVGAFLDRAR